MAGLWNRILLVPLLVAVVSYFSGDPYFMLNRFAGRRHQEMPTVHKQHGPLNNDKCWRVRAAEACEDVRIHHPTGEAFLACGYVQTRNVYYPPMGRHDNTNAPSYNEYFVKYDIKANTTVRLKIEGLDPSHDIITHGLQLLVPKDDKTKIYLFAVNHARQGSSIIRFSHRLGTDVLTFDREFAHPKIKTPNAVAPTGLNSFFISNDHYFWGGFLGGIPRLLELALGPWTWASDVVHCTATDASVDCKTVSPKGAHSSTNGILLSDDGKTLFVNDIRLATTTEYAVNPATHELTIKQVISLGAGADNISEIPGSGDMILAIFPDLAALINRLFYDTLNEDHHAEAGLLRLVKKKNYAPELFYWDDGSILSALTGAAVDPVNRRIIAGSVVNTFFIVCDISGAKL